MDVSQLKLCNETLAQDAFLTEHRHDWLKTLIRRSVRDL